MKGADKVIVLTQSYWQTQYQESPEILGKEVLPEIERYKPPVPKREIAPRTEPLAKFVD